MKEDPVERFHMLWTWKESLMKATGQGMSLSPASFDVLPFSRKEPVFLDGKRWYAASGLLEDTRFSVCASYPVLLELRLWDPLQ